MFERSEFAACPRWTSTAGSRSDSGGRRQWGQPFFGLRLDGCAKKGDCPAGGTARPAATVAPNAAQATTNLYPKYLRKNGFSAYSTCASSYEKQSISHLHWSKKECLNQRSRKASTPALFRPKLCSSAHLEGDPGSGINPAVPSIAPRARAGGQWQWLHPSRCFCFDSEK